ncbi:MAG: DUF3298 domain-containing protein, partial [Defluviitaleaceae bacterium]|nr:DUF3298 domain-containing protein [Defluviitaleaceae bacterium]
MKKSAVFAAAILIWLAFGAVGVFAAQRIIITDHSVTEDRFDLEIAGSLPEVSGMTNITLQTELNSLIRQQFDDMTKTAADSSARRINFAYEHKPDGEFNSIVMRISTATISVRDDVRTFVLGPGGRLLTVNDVLGPNGVKIINQVIAQEIARRPGTFNADFGGISEDQSFYVQNGNVVVIFSKYAIGPAAVGTPEFRVNIENVRNNTFTILRADTYTRDPYNVRMIPLRVVAEGIGFGVVWDGHTHPIVITRGSRDNLAATLTIGSNAYFRSRQPAVTLEHAPEIRDNLTHLPISFF